MGRVALDLLFARMIDETEQGSNLGKDRILPTRNWCCKSA
jgi:hypothetical protein